MNFIDERHSLYVGWVCGTALRNGLQVTPVVNADGDYTDQLTLTLTPPAEVITIVVPYPPEEWAP